MERQWTIFCLMVHTVWQAKYVQSTNYFFAFDACTGFVSNANAAGTCTVTSDDSAVGTYSKNNVRIQNGYIDYGSTVYQPYGCPFKNDLTTCPNGWSYYGWMQVVNYPSNCTTFGVIISTPVFNLHLLGNGHLALYSWLPNGTEYYAETLAPIMTKIWYPIFLEFKLFTSNSSYTLSLFAQGQLMALTQVGRQRTYTPPTSNIVVGGSGVANSADVKMDRAFFDNTPQSMPTYFQNVLDVNGRGVACATTLSGVLVRPLTCYWVGTSALSWSAAYASCQSTAYTSGFPYAKLAQFPASNATFWASFLVKLASYGNGSAAGYSAWLGGGHSLQWLNASGVSLNVSAVVPVGVTSNNSTSTSTSCLQINTKTSPWEWSETLCTVAQKYVCSASFDCIMDNPCQNLGVCLPVNDGVNVCKCWPGSSGQFCQNGTITTNYIINNNTNCAPPQPTTTTIITTTTAIPTTTMIPTTTPTVTTPAPTTTTTIASTTPTTTVPTTTPTITTVAPTSMSTTTPTITTTVITTTTQTAAPIPTSASTTTIAVPSTTPTTTPTTTTLNTTPTIITTTATTKDTPNTPSVTTTATPFTNNCSECENEFKVLSKMISMYKIELKMKLINIDVEQDEFELWECNTTATFMNISKPVFNYTYNDSDDDDCSYNIWKLFSKCLLKIKIIRWFMKIIAAKNHNGFPTYLNENWALINEYVQGLSNLTCYTELIAGHLNDTEYQPIIHFCNLDDDDHGHSNSHHGDGDYDGDNSDC